MTPAGGKLWRWKYRFEGAEKLMPLGKYPEVPLAQARERHVAARALLANGVDPMAKRKTEKTAKLAQTEGSFQNIASLWMEHWKTGTSPRHVESTQRRLEKDTGNSSKSKFRLVGRFSPKANPDYKAQTGEDELNTVIATDVLSEGLDMQDCDTIINYDLHWNPLRLIQRFGRIDRIGSTHDKVFGLNFLPELGIEQNLGLRACLSQRIAEIQETVGEDSAILDPSEQINEEAMYAIYDDKSTSLDLFEPEEPMGLGEAEGIIRQLEAVDPAEFDRIASLRDGIRSGMNSLSPGIFVLCQAGDFQQLFFANPQGEIETRDASTILGRLKCTPSTPSVPLPDNYNVAVMKVYQQFSEEVAHRKTTLEHSSSQTVGQRYVSQELKAFGATLEDDDQRLSDVAILQRAYGSNVLSAAVQTELRRIRNHKLTGESLFARLRAIYDQHRLSQLQEHIRTDRENAIPRIVCSEFLA